VIQRPQTIFLVLAVIANLIVFFTPIYRHAVNDPAAWIGLGFAISLTLAMIIALVSIFLFKNRMNQLKGVKMATYIQIIGLGFAAGVLFSLGGFGTFLWREVLGSGLIVIALAMFWLAGRSIKKDEELVKSMDRIR
jgi:heme exporter protein D